MRLSEVKGERVFEVMADLVGPVCDIATSESFKSMLQRESCPEDMEPREFMAQRLKEGIPSVIREHEGNIVLVLSTIAGISAEEYLSNMTLISLWSDVMELVSDGDFLDFLASLDVLMGEKTSS